VAGAGGSLVGTGTSLSPSSLHQGVLLVVAKDEECHYGTTPWPGNVIGQWLHVRLLM